MRNVIMKGYMEEGKYFCNDSCDYIVVLKSYENVFINKVSFKWPNFASCHFKALPMGYNPLSPMILPFF
jgi:hypothetical protein